MNNKTEIEPRIKLARSIKDSFKKFNINIEGKTKSEILKKPSLIESLVVSLNEVYKNENLGTNYNNESLLAPNILLAPYNGAVLQDRTKAFFITFIKILNPDLYKTTEEEHLELNSSYKNILNIYKAFSELQEKWDLETYENDKSIENGGKIVKGALGVVVKGVDKIAYHFNGGVENSTKYFAENIRTSHKLQKFKNTIASTAKKSAEIYDKVNDKFTN